LHALDCPDLTHDSSIVPDEHSRSSVPLTRITTCAGELETLPGKPDLTYRSKFARLTQSSSGVKEAGLGCGNRYSQHIRRLTHGPLLQLAHFDSLPDRRAQVSNGGLENSFSLGLCVELFRVGGGV